MKIIRKIIAVAALMGILFGVTAAADSRSYWFPFPSYGVGSMCYSELVNPKSTSAPSVKYSVQVHGTCYFLSSSRTASDQDTNIVTIPTNSLAKYPFTWTDNSSSSYYLIGYPDIYSGTWSDYTGIGTWVN